MTRVVQKKNENTFEWVIAEIANAKTYNLRRKLYDITCSFTVNQSGLWCRSISWEIESFDYRIEMRYWLWPEIVSCWCNFFCGFKIISICSFKYELGHIFIKKSVNNQKKWKVFKFKVHCINLIYQYFIN